jgi:hypothetical protein
MTLLLTSRPLCLYLKMGTPVRLDLGGDFCRAVAYCKGRFWQGRPHPGLPRWVHRDLPPPSRRCARRALRSGGGSLLWTTWTIRHDVAKRYGQTEHQQIATDSGRRSQPGRSPTQSRSDRCPPPGSDGLPARARPRPRAAACFPTESSAVQGPCAHGRSDGGRWRENRVVRRIDAEPV